MAISEESLTNMLSAMGREIGNAIATANTAAQNASAARATDDRAALLQSMRGLVRSSGGERWLLGDNQATIFTANNPETSQRSKHLEIRWFRVRDYVQNQTLRVRHIPTGGNVADFFTKSLQGPDSFERFRRQLMGDQDFAPRPRPHR